MKISHASNQQGMAMADRDMSGSLSKNDHNQQPNHADYVGSIVIEGRKYWLNGWIKENDRGKWLSLSAKPAEERKADASSAPIDDEIAQAAQITAREVPVLRRGASGQLRFSSAARCIASL